MIGAKVSVGISFLRITPITKRTYRIIIHAVMYISILTGLMFGLLTTFQCRPVQYFWTRALGDNGTCISMNVIMAFTYVMSAIYASCDFSFAILPIVLIRELNMSRNSKIALIPILSMACIASAAVIVRLAYVPTFRSPEFLYATVPIAIWSEIEMSLAITAGSLPTLRPLYRVAASKFNWKTSFFSTQRSYGKMPDNRKRGKGAAPVSQKELSFTNCSESERNIVKYEEFALEDRRPSSGDHGTGITKVTNIQVSFEDEKKT
ncbi:hypothetical protein N0V90_011927 [Kalmusia sp. IMI 367209]|nr:hypothetical protein N0V90_011927 [Kalmusia sp. IMI 367209]